MSKRAKTVVRLFLGVTTVKPIASPEYVQSLERLFNGVASELLPTDIVLHEGRGGKQPFSIEAVKALHRWDPRELADIDLKYSGRIRGGITICPHWGFPGRWGAFTEEFEPPPGGNTISASFDLSTIVQRDLFDDALRLFQNMIEFTHACHGRALIAPASTAKHIVFDDPEYSKPYAIEWNGVIIEPHDVDAGYRNGQAVNCLPCFENWINVLGGEYVELLGRDNLLGLDVYSKHEDSAGRIWLQITERPEQMYVPEVKAHVIHLMEALNAQDVFCREPRTDEERKYGVEGYRRPNFDLSGLKAPQLDPFSKDRSRAGINVGRDTIWFSEGYLEQIPRKRKHHFETLVWTLLKNALPGGANTGPIGAALTDDGKLLQVTADGDMGQTSPEQADLLVERLVALRKQRSIKAVGACWVDPILDESNESTAVTIHLESADGDAYVISLPFEQRGRKREYGTLVIEPGSFPVVFADGE